VIKQLDGREIVLESEEITQPGFVKAIEEEGMPIFNSNQKGNLYVKINVEIPNFSEEEL
jgi:DnaJ-related protein SCJ1